MIVGVDCRQLNMGVSEFCRIYSSLFCTSRDSSFRSKSWVALMLLEAPISLTLRFLNQNFKNRTDCGNKWTHGSFSPLLSISVSIGLDLLLWVAIILL